MFLRFLQPIFLFARFHNTVCSWGGIPNWLNKLNTSQQAPQSSRALRHSKRVILSWFCISPLNQFKRIKPTNTYAIATTRTVVGIFQFNVCSFFILNQIEYIMITFLHATPASGAIFLQHMHNPVSSMFLPV